MRANCKLQIGNALLSSHNGKSSCGVLGFCYGEVYFFPLPFRDDETNSVQSISSIKKLCIFLENLVWLMTLTCSSRFTVLSKFPNTTVSPSGVRILR